MINVSIVLFHNKERQIKNILKDILNNDNGLLSKIYLIDNSEDDVLSSLSLVSEKIEYIYLNKNIGYGSAHNIALRHSISDSIKFHVVMNPDLRLKGRDIFDKLSAYLLSNLNVGLVMPDVYYPNKERQLLCKLLPSPAVLFSRRFFGQMITNIFFSKYNLKFLDYSRVMNPPCLSGCFMFLNVQVLKDVGIFDERFFMYLEDFDLSRRIHKKYDTIFYPDVKIIHEYQKGSYKNIKLLKFHIFSAIKYFNKYGWFFDFDRYNFNSKFLKRVQFDKK